MFSLDTGRFRKVKREVVPKVACRSREGLRHIKIMISVDSRRMKVPGRTNAFLTSCTKGSAC